MTKKELPQSLVFGAIGVIQGLIFWNAYSRWGPDPSINALCAASIVFAAVAGLFLQLAWGEERKRLYAFSLFLGVVLALMAFWSWAQLPEDEALFRGDGFRVFTSISASFLAVYILLPYVQIFQESGRMKFPYTELFRHGWNNYFILLVAFIFAGLYWGLISLWAGLFYLIGIKFFGNIFFTGYFSLITLPAAFGLGISIGKLNNKIINTIRNIALGLYKALLPLLALITLLFLAALPFTGLKPLWDTKQASVITLGLLISQIVFINAVFQDGASGPPYNRFIRKAVEAMVVVMPAFAAITLYSVSLRIDQHGLTPDRIYALVFAVIAAFYSTGYAASIVKRGEVWMGWLRPVNVFMSFFIVTVALLLHTPFFDTLRMSAQNQVGRLVAGKVKAADFDYRALRFSLGHEGYERLKGLAGLAHPEAEIIKKKVEVALKADYWDSRSAKESLEVGDLKVIAVNGAPEGLIEAINGRSDLFNAQRCSQKNDCIVFSKNIDADPEEEYFFVPSIINSGMLLFDKLDSKWEYVGQFDMGSGCKDESERKTFIDAIEKGEIELLQPEYSDLKVSGKELRFKRKFY